MEIQPGGSILDRDSRERESIVRVGPDAATIAGEQRRDERVGSAFHSG